MITEEGEYTVIVTVDSCNGEDSIVVNLRDDLEVVVDEDFITCPNELQIITATTIEEGVSYQWFLNGDPIPGETNSTLEISLEAGLLGAQTYSVVITLGSCTATDSVDVTLYPVGNCIISEGISPNGDGFNDILDLTFLNDRTGISKLQIFNRLGTLVFEQNNYTNQWRGQTNDGNDLPTGTYFYVIDLAGNDAVYGSQATGWIYLNQEAN
jgi:gliding motility-associated-like protein